MGNTLIAPANADKVVGSAGKNISIVVPANDAKAAEAARQLHIKPLGVKPGQYECFEIRNIPQEYQGNNSMTGFKVCLSPNTGTKAILVSTIPKEPDDDKSMLSDQLSFVFEDQNNLRGRQYKLSHPEDTAFDHYPGSQKDLNSSYLNVFRANLSQQGYGSNDTVYSTAGDDSFVTEITRLPQQEK